jgi:hypothetical protein
MVAQPRRAIGEKEVIEVWVIDDQRQEHGDEG